MSGPRPEGRLSASAIYEGWVRHRRLDPVEHSFRYPIFMVYLDLDELPEVLDPLRGWSARRPAPAWFRRADHLGAEDVPLAEAVRDAVAAETGEPPARPDPGADQPALLRALLQPGQLLLLLRRPVPGSRRCSPRSTTRRGASRTLT